ncbi:hypothetical protein ACODYM_29140 [Burkholderia gladioli]|uniref:hypothetical protein n=1 Tax=Burkholderia gladioli TaxID=28095 RepID=UPI003B4FFC5A
MRITAAQQKAFDRFVEAQGSKPFRRHDLSEALRLAVRQRTAGNAVPVADYLITKLRAENRLVKAGHVHWALVTPADRTLQSGRKVPALSTTVDLSLKTSCPEKWVALDLETGEVWAGSPNHWKRAPAEVRAEALSILSAAR